MLKIIRPAVALLILCSWDLKVSNEISKAEWLIGTWRMTTPKGNIYESWKRTSQYELSGKSYRLKDKDTVVFETVRLVQEQDSLFYSPTVKQQNGGLPVRFARKSISDEELIFENP